MLIEIHMIQNHSPANLNRDDLDAPKTCWFGGVLRNRVSSQCLKRSIRMSDEFRALLGGIRTRQLAKLIAERVQGKADVKKRAAGVLKKCGIATNDDGRSDMLVYTTDAAITKMAELLQNSNSDNGLEEQFGNLISSRTASPDMALAGRMLETGVIKDTSVEAALQVSHAISTHTARPEVDYYVAKDDIPGEDAGAAFVDEALFASACFYKYFSIHWEQLVKNLEGFQGNKEHLAAHTVGAFLRGAALTTPTGKQNSFAAQNPPDGILVEIRNGTPVNYANGFAKPVEVGERDLVSQSIAQLAGYVHDIDIGYGKSQQRFWFSPNLKYRLTTVQDKQEVTLTENNIKSLDELVSALIKAIGYDWSEVQKTVINPVAAQ